MLPSLPNTIAVRLEHFLSYGTSAASREDALMIRRSRGFAVIGLSALFLGGVVFLAAYGQMELAARAAVMLVVMIGGVGIGMIQESRWIKPVTHLGFGFMLVGIVSAATGIGGGSEVAATFPILLVLVAYLAWLKGRWRVCGLCLGLGTSIKLFPALLAVALGLYMLRQRRLRELAATAAWAALPILVVELGFLLALEARGADHSFWLRAYTWTFQMPARMDTWQGIAAHHLDFRFGRERGDAEGYGGERRCEQLSEHWELHPGFTGEV